MIRSFLTVAAASALAVPSAFAGVYVNVENNGSFTGKDFTTATTDFHVGYEGEAGALGYYVQGGPAGSSGRPGRRGGRPVRAPRRARAPARGRAQGARARRGGEQGAAEEGERGAEVERVRGDVGSGGRGRVGKGIMSDR